MAKTKKGQVGTCKLTGNCGPFVKSHIIPRALSLPRAGGIAFPQLGQRERPSRRFDSWYDLALVTQAGEGILTDYDTCAIEELRRLKLVWQSWGPMKALSTSDADMFPGTPNGIRQISFDYAAKMRLFFLSLLWRAAVTDRREFSEITLKSSDARRLRRAVRDGDTNLPDDFFPITLSQISTRGLSHNHGPISEVKQPVTVGKYTGKPLPIFRVYFDGLSVHIHTKADNEAVDGLKPMLVGPNNKIVLPTVTWEASWQAQNLANVMADAEYEFPGAVAGADGRKSDQD
ncbi:hypothetical protein QWY75_11025 [Pontixanthobacter aestiaquae]|uniref:Uncharacterized protein n=1 Tax=Pontixanthobacter aestiaquae TaxID=1509367 RepID=A0A844Z456_9SPHN|nr:hypothetical protein [Pontixanthobacter aestiaquae]MDN3646733.1 hypothetical protein [Pontixanthobacter aestiaquae]MXO82284.1 hypothetical protein [Pontixanthobacter aestiaquae]